MGTTISRLSSACSGSDDGGEAGNESEEKELKFARSAKAVAVGPGGCSARRTTPGFHHGKLFCSDPVGVDEWLSFSITAGSDCCLRVGYSTRAPWTTDQKLGETLEKRIMRKFSGERCRLASLPAGARVDRVQFKVTHKGQIVWRSGDLEPPSVLLDCDQQLSGQIWPVLDVCGADVQLQLSSRRRREAGTTVRWEKLAPCNLVPVKSGQRSYWAPTRETAASASGSGFYAFSELALPQGHELVLEVTAVAAGAGVAFGATDWRPTVDYEEFVLPHRPADLLIDSSSHLWAAGFAEFADVTVGEELGIGIAIDDHLRPVVSLRRISRASAPRHLPIPSANLLHCFLELNSGCVRAVRTVAMLKSSIETIATSALLPRSPSHCAICRDNPAAVAVVPCGHLCLCPACSDVIDADMQLCPVCCTTVQRLLRILPA